MNDSQWKAIIWTARCSGTLSIIGSGTIVFMILRDFRNKTSHPRNRILLVMSLIDILSSISWVISTAAAPEGSRYGARGNETTCTIQGFFITFGLTVPAYNAMLCLYYLAFIRYKIDKKTFAKKYESWMHFVAITVTFAFAVVGAVFHLYHSHFTICWIAQECKISSSEIKCEDDPVTDRAILGIQIFAMIMSVIYFIIIMGSMVGVYLAVRKPTEDIKKYEFRQQRTKKRRSSFNGFNREEDRETAKQALLFVLVYLVTYIPPFLMVICQDFQDYLEPRHAIFRFNLIMNILTPLQGFWNFIIFLRPRFHHVRKHNYEDKNIFWILKTAILTKELGRPSSTRGNRTSFPNNVTRRHSLPSYLNKGNNEVSSAGIVTSALDNELDLGLTPDKPVQRRHSLPSRLTSICDLILPLSLSGAVSTLDLESGFAQSG